MRPNRRGPHWRRSLSSSLQCEGNARRLCAAYRRSRGGCKMSNTELKLNKRGDLQIVWERVLRKLADEFKCNLVRGKDGALGLEAFEVDMVGAEMEVFSDII